MRGDPLTKSDWYYLDVFNQAQGPFPTKTVQSMARDYDFYVWKQGLPDWTLAHTLSEIIPTAETNKRIYTLHLSATAIPSTDLDEHGQPRNIRLNAVQNLRKSLDELYGLCKGFLADSKLTGEEISFLDRWLTNSQTAQTWPADIISRRIREILEDGVISGEELDDLQIILQKAVGERPDVKEVTNLATRLPLTEPPPDILVSGHSFCFTGKFIYGTRIQCQQAVVMRGGIAENRVVQDLNYLVIGTIASRDWAHTAHGRKIEAARANGERTKIICEEHWIKYISQV